MAQEIERSFVADPDRLPSLEGLPFEDITQTYYTPYPADPRYPEVADGEWRVREIRGSNGATTHTATVKFGDKASGSRTEIETDIASTAFGAKIQEDGDQRWFPDATLRGQATVKKRRFHLPDGSLLDQLDPELHGDIWLAEREFDSLADAAAWQPPAWCDTSQKPPKNRELARPLKRTVSQESIIGKTYDQLRHEIRQHHTRIGQTVITVSGFSGSGKTTLARQLAAEFQAPLISADDYHIGVTALLRKYGMINHDLPHTYNHRRLSQDVAALLAGQTVETPRYDFAVSEPSAETESITLDEPGIVVIEGLYAYLTGLDKYNHTVSQAKYEICLNTPFYVNVLRRLKRDVSVSEEDAAPNRRRVTMTAAQSLKYLHDTAIPTYFEHAKSFKHPLVSEHGNFDAFVQSASS